MCCHMPCFSQLIWIPTLVDTDLYFQSSKLIKIYDVLCFLCEYKFHICFWAFEGSLFPAADASIKLTEGEPVFGLCHGNIHKPTED